MTTLDATMTPAKPVIARIDPCSQCGKRADYNAPCIEVGHDLQTAPIWCDHCSGADRSGKFFLSLEQHTRDGQRSWHHGTCWTARYNGVVAHCDSTRTPNMAWMQGGRVSVPHSRLTEIWTRSQNHADPLLATLQAIWALDEQNKIWCTNCAEETEVAKIAGRPLFTGANCATCWPKHVAHLDAQRKAGHVCRMCNQPYDNCCC